MWLRSSILVLTLCLSAAGSRPPAPTLPPELSKLLPEDVALTRSDLERLARSEIVARVVESRDPREILTLSALRVQCSAAQARAALEDVVTRGGRAHVLEIGVVPDRPSPGDLRALSLDSSDARSLAACRAGHCDLRLSGPYMELFREAVDWSSPRGRERGASLWREMLVRYASAYRSSGDAGLPHYEDNHEPTSVGQTLELLVSRFPAAQRAYPDLFAFLREFPHHPLEGGSQALYWSRERFWRKSVTSLNHQALVERALGGRRALLAATKQLYANHYFDASLSLTFFVEDPAGSYLVRIGRARADIRPPGFNWIERAMVRHFVTPRLEEEMACLRARLQPRLPLTADRDGELRP